MRVKTALARATAGVPNGTFALPVVAIAPEFAEAAAFLVSIEGDGTDPTIPNEKALIAVSLGATVDTGLFPDSADDDGGTAWAVSPAVWNYLRADRF